MHENLLQELEASGSQVSLSFDAVAPAFSDWLYERSDLWCVGSSVQHEIYTRLFGSRSTD